MPDLQTELSKVALPAHFDDDVPTTETQKPMKTSAQIVYDIVTKYPNLTRNDIRKHAVQHGVAGGTAITYITQFAHSGVFGKKHNQSGVMTYHTAAPYRPPMSGVRKQKATKVSMATSKPIETINIDDLKLYEARALYEQLKAIFESK